MVWSPSTSGHTEHHGHPDWDDQGASDRKSEVGHLPLGERLPTASDQLSAQRSSVTPRDDQPEERALHWTGIVGLFFRARDPAALARWYADHLGIDPAPTTHEQPPWWQRPGPTVLAPFPADSDAFGCPEQAWMLNLRVRDLDAMVTQLGAAGIQVTLDPQTYPNGWFASTADPEGNPIQLWEPSPDALQEPPDRRR
jgi:glyoxylase I family protein